MRQPSKSLGVCMCGNSEARILPEPCEMDEVCAIG
jgi:hypothetical protein